ncbi:DegT/DnrJ/EryC1/StrS family aminotransferase [Streptomyces sp. NPDC060194]|uniref:DegT/DnrJ/EryC1/StrS family aminotransferase n=1 Tax=Streptomyces sp. NPDC060194 TaxID=3347069 RepID=UPI0036656581
MATLPVLKAAGIGPGHEVIVPAFGNVEVAEAVVLAGAVPVFADVDPETYCLTANTVAAVAGERTAAVVAVRRFGYPVERAGLRGLGERLGIQVFLHEDLEGDGLMNEPSAHVERRRAYAGRLRERLQGVGVPAGVAGHDYRQFVVRVPGNGRPDRDAFVRALRGRGVECRAPVRTPLHRMPGFRRDVLLPETERAAEETVALPLGNVPTRRHLERVAAACNALGGLAQPAF